MRLERDRAVFDSSEELVSTIADMARTIIRGKAALQQLVGALFPEPDKLPPECAKCPIIERIGTKLKPVAPQFGRWRESPTGGLTPGGTPLYVCGWCGGSEHLHGCEYPTRKIVCDQCGQINIYPWESSYEEEETP